MKYSTKTGNATSATTACLVVPRSRATAIAEALGIGEQMRLTLDSTENKTGHVATVFSSGKPSRLLVVGKQDEAKTVAAFHKNMQAVAKAVAKLNVADATLCLDDFEVEDKNIHWKTRIALAAISHASYRFDAYKSKKPKAAKLRRVAVLAKDRTAARLAVRHAQALDAGLALAKDLGNQPPNVCNPTFVAEAADALATDGVTVEVIEEDAMAELGMGAFLSVTKGTDTPAKMSIVRYQGAAANEAPCVLIGKGITFDSGGINLKTNASIAEMKFDMCGAASVLGVAKAVIDAQLPINLIAITAAAENMPGGRASRPGDIVTTMSGRTVEILNTDAEGRLVLCDALTYAERFKPRVVIDVATLTGAQVVALGSQASALYANDEGLADALLAAGEQSSDRLWRMPMWEEYQEQLKSTCADMKNIGGSAAGSITAACFLSRFAKAFPWAHLDIAGPSYKKDKGSTGRPVSALFQYLLDSAS